MHYDLLYRPEALDHNRFSVRHATNLLEYTRGIFHVGQITQELRTGALARSAGLNVL